MGKEYFLHEFVEEEINEGLKRIPTEFKDESLIWSKFIKGDNSALSYIYQTYANSLYNYGRQFTDEDTVQDCIQDLFYDLIKSRKKLGSAISIKAYLFSSLRRKIARKVKRKVLEIGENNLDSVAKFKVSIASENSAPVDNSTQNRLELLKNACNSLPAR